MDEADHSHYVAQLKAEFDSCDTTSTGFLDREELTVLCQKLQLDAHLPLILDTLLGERTYTRVNFEEFKDGFVAVLSRSLDFSTSDDESSYLEPVSPEEVEPIFVKGTKHYGQNSCSDSKLNAAVTCDSEDSPLTRTEATDSSPPGVCRAKLRQSMSLDSVESLKSDEEVGNQRENIQPEFPSKADPQEDVEQSVNGGGGSGVHVMMTTYEHGLQQHNTEGLDLLLRKLDANLDGRVSNRNFQCFGSNPLSCSTPVQPAEQQRTLHRSQSLLEECSARSTSPSLLTAAVGQRIFSQLDDGSGCTKPERVVALWTEEGILNSRDILQTLDFSLEERISLEDLTLALDNELLVSGNGIHQAALISYKNEIQHLQVVAEQACKERDKVKADLDLANQRNLQLIGEVDDRNANMELLNQKMIRDLEQDFRDRLTALRSQSEQDSEALLQQVERERNNLQKELQLLRGQEAELQEELSSATKECRHLEDELTVVKLKLTDAENLVNKLQSDLDQLLHDKFGSLDPAGAGLGHDERFTEIIKEYELQCRELQDKNDELSTELELLKGQRGDRKTKRAAAESTALSCTEQRTDSAESDSGDLDMKCNSSPRVKKKLLPADKTTLCSLDSVSGPAVSIQTELALEQLKQIHNQDLQQLHIQLETQVNYYERSLERMRQSMEVERKDIAQAFKLEISELEEQKAQAEQQVKQLKEALDKLHTEIQHGGRGGQGWSNEQERRMQWEQAELEQNFAREISNLVQRLSAEKEQLQAEMKLKMDQEVMLVREESEQRLGQMKLLYAEDQRNFLHQLHHEHQQLQEQRGFWENQLILLEQEKLQCEERAREDQARICSQFTSEKKRVEEQHETAVFQLKEQVSRIKEIIQSYKLQINQSEISLEELMDKCSQGGEELTTSLERCTDLEARLEEACMQLVESVTFIESHEALSKDLSSEKSSVEEELQVVKAREKQLKTQVNQLMEQLGNLQATSDSIIQDRELVADNCSCLSNAFTQQQALRAEIEKEALRTRAESVSKLAAELESLKTDRARLIQDLKDQAMAVDNLQLELDGALEELKKRSSTEDSLQEALKQEQIRTLQLNSSLEEEKEEVCRLSQENISYLRLADQLSTQIVEMEEESSTLRDRLRDLNSQFNETADLVLELRRQLNSKTNEVDQLRAEVADSAEFFHQAKSSLERQCQDVQLEAKERDLDWAREQVNQLQQALQDSQDQLRKAEENLEQEKRRMTQQLMDLEKLVLALEEVMDPASSHRTQLEEVRSEKGALQERLSILQQEIQNLEDDIAKKRRKLEGMEREHERSREEEERLHKENSKYREEVLDLSSRNLQLSNDNAELSAHLHGERESVSMLQERLAAMSKELQEGDDAIRQLQDTVMQQEKEKLQQQAVWTQERQVLERQLSSCKDKLSHLSEVETELKSVILRQKWLEEDKAKLLREADDRNNKVEKLQQSVLSLELEAELLRSQLNTSNQHKLGHSQEVTELQKKLQDTHNTVKEFETKIRKLMKEKEDLCQAMEEQEEKAAITLQEETQRLRIQNQDLQCKLSELQIQGLEVQKLTQEQLNLKTKLSELEKSQTQAKNRAMRTDTAFSVVQMQHFRQLQERQEQEGDGLRERMDHLQSRLLEEQRRSQQLEETLTQQAQQSNSQMSVKQDQYDKAMASLHLRMEDLEIKLKGVQLALQEKVQQLKEQLVKNNKSNKLLKDLYVENSQLMKALQVTEQRQKNAEKRNYLLEDKVKALNKLLREIVPASLPRSC
ncbi:ninein-like protein isoform X2 [Echeneis naucrates]|uniref:EF-hand domain-containing protein n=1 Tax=Echeneis naucrates TaxID=173247 RepID=A0A665TWQ9_ECHNA|nr:ninein-like protein isoform X2 [Echeneis naucrates]